MTEPPDDRELLEELAPFLQSARETEDPKTIPPEDLAGRILSERRSGGPATSAPHDSLPRPFGPYELHSILGRGGSATVYAGFDPELQRKIAIKILAPELAAIDTARERFLREAQAAAQLHHDHIMPIFAVHQDTPLPSLTMPLMEGRTLQDRLNFEGVLPPEEIARIGSELAAALHEAHEAGYVHRDVKPSNVFLEAGLGRARLMDFGLAKTEEASGLTQPGVLAGTPEYLAPEQLDGIDPGPRSDLYGLGATLYAMATTAPPFAGPSLTSLLKKIAADPPPPLPGRFPKPLRQLIGDLLEKDPGRRPDSAATVRDRLARIQQREDRAPDSSPSSRWIPFAWLGAILVVFGVGFLIQQSYRERHAEMMSRREANPTLVEVADLEELRKSLLAPNPREVVIRLTTAGAYTLPSLDLGDRNITIEAATPGTSLHWDSASGPGLRSQGKLTLRNLVIHQEVSTRSGLTPPLIEYSGQDLRLESCQLEQTQNQRTSQPSGSLVAVRSAAKVTADRCRAILFFSPLFECHDPGAEIAVKDSLAFAPGFFVTTGGGKVSATGCSFATHFAFKAQGPPATTIAPQRCYIQAQYSVLWLPGASDDEEVAERLRWEGGDNRYSSYWVFLFTNSIAPGRRLPRDLRPGSQRELPREHHWPAFSDWVSHWGTADPNAKQWPVPLVWPAGSIGTVTNDDIVAEFRNVYREGFGVDPARTGPFAR